ncbi:MAG: hypothetical protein EOM17_13650 [Synergistales bacterium]|nr:hypothetical protein [Synergistales bacterium]
MIKERIEKLRGVMRTNNISAYIVPGTDPLIGTSSDADGNFRLEKIPVGRVDLQVSFIGYKTANLNNLMHTSGKELVLKIDLDFFPIIGIFEV